MIWGKAIKESLMKYLRKQKGLEESDLKELFMNQFSPLPLLCLTEWKCLFTHPLYWRPLSVPPSPPLGCVMCLPSSPVSINHLSIRETVCVLMNSVSAAVWDLHCTDGGATQFILCLLQHILPSDLRVSSITVRCEDEHIQRNLEQELCTGSTDSCCCWSLSNSLWFEEEKLKLQLNISIEYAWERPTGNASEHYCTSQQLWRK